MIAALALAICLVWLLVEFSQKSGSREQESSELEAGLQESGRGQATVTSFSIGRAELSHPSAIDKSNTDHRFTRFNDGVTYWHHSVQLSNDLHRKNQDVSRDLEIIDEILSNYRLVLKENPVGTDNEEFAAALAGENSKQVVFIDPNLLSDGELLDRYGSPYVFHPLKADVMDLRSLGPDRQLWTTDDVSLGLQEIESELGLVRDE